MLIEHFGLTWPWREKQSDYSCNVDKEAQEDVWDTGKLPRLT